ncbi:hypothetical protein BJV77DRAFT_1070508 [Russula vinacea]|nr:hypothetical protein BJV77DRAFT_1070508 [Russula vinacea]
MAAKLKNGTYHISIVIGGVKKYVDLTESNTNPNTPIIGFTPDDSKNNQKGDKVVVGDRQFYELVEKHGNYRIQIRGGNLVWRLPNNNDLTQIELQPPGLGNDEWTFTLIFSQ